MRRKTTYGDVNPLRPDLSNVPDVYTETIEDLFDTWLNVRARNKVLRDYYEMKQGVQNLGISIPPHPQGYKLRDGVVR